MKRICSSLFVLLLLATVFVVGQAQWYRGDLKETLRRLEEDTDRFRKSLDYDLDHSALNGSQSEDQINRYVHDFEEATDKLKDRHDDQKASPMLAREVLVRGRSINQFMRRHRPGGRSMTDWAIVRQSLDRLAYAYQIKWRW